METAVNRMQLKCRLAVIYSNLPSIVRPKKPLDLIVDETTKKPDLARAICDLNPNCDQVLKRLYAQATAGRRRETAKRRRDQDRVFWATLAKQAPQFAQVLYTALQVIK